MLPIGIKMHYIGCSLPFGKLHPGLQGRTLPKVDRVSQVENG